jgi:excisionase family DNA binding protein
MEERHLSLSEAADALNISERTAYRWIKSGKLRAYKPGRDYWIPESAIKEVVKESVVRPKAPAPPSQPSFDNHLRAEEQTEELGTKWEAAVSSARQLRERAQARVEELLAAWQTSKDREEDPAERRRYLDEMGELLQEAYDARPTLFEATSWERLADQWPEIQAADRFYNELWRLVEAAGLSIRTGNAQEERPKAVEESKAA